MKFPIRSLHQIEMTSHCNLRCRYCPSPKLPREKLHMSDEHYALAIKWAGFFVRAGTQRELNLAGIGESTMHPEFVRNCHLAREAIGPNCNLVLATNGLLMTDELARAIAPTKMMIWVSMHRPEKAGPAIEILKRHGLLSGVSADPSVAATNWAGQVEWHVSAAKRTCEWVIGGRLTALADGRLTRCCIDASGIGVVGTLHDDLTQMHTSPYELCRTCDQDVGVPMDDEEEAAA